MRSITTCLACWSWPSVNSVHGIPYLSSLAMQWRQAVNTVLFKWFPINRAPCMVQAVAWQTNCTRRRIPINVLAYMQWWRLVHWIWSAGSMNCWYTVWLLKCSELKRIESSALDIYTCSCLSWWWKIYQTRHISTSWSIHISTVYWTCWQTWLFRPCHHVSWLISFTLSARQ